MVAYIKSGFKIDHSSVHVLISTLRTSTGNYVNNSHSFNDFTDLILQNCPTYLTELNAGVDFCNCLTAPLSFRKDCRVNIMISYLFENLPDQNQNFVWAEWPSSSFVSSAAGVFKEIFTCYHWNWKTYYFYFLLIPCIYLDKKLPQFVIRYICNFNGNL